MKQNPNSLEPRRLVSATDTGHFDFKFPSPISEPALQNDIVFCGKVMVQQTEPVHVTRERNPFLVRSESFRKLGSGRSGSLRLPATGDRRLRRSSSSWRQLNNLFGVVKFPVQMELSDMKKRQERRESEALLPNTPAAGDGKSCWQLIRRLRRKGQRHLFNALPTASFRCFPRL
ncbi:hypothetical protein SESBI_34635 [Sesbania bispinosa]|nr:hypothetical protein SESBI_34635 [Sesbania bispinosa]